MEYLFNLEDVVKLNSFNNMFSDARILAMYNKKMKHKYLGQESVSIRMAANTLAETIAECFIYADKDYLLDNFLISTQADQTRYKLLADGLFEEYFNVGPGGRPYYPEVS